MEALFYALLHGGWVFVVGAAVAIWAWLKLILDRRRTRTAALAEARDQQKAADDAAAFKAVEALFKLGRMPAAERRELLQQQSDAERARRLHQSERGGGADR